jgi:hypothetical protein
LAEESPRQEKKVRSDRMKTHLLNQWEKDHLSRFTPVWSVTNAARTMNGKQGVKVKYFFQTYCLESFHRSVAIFLTSTHTPEDFTKNKVSPRDGANLAALHHA